ncbi:MAG TPA: substrate-binding domain-containing protein [Pirellulaceae bacterium]|nr:substrate-binding domain-containing protein [Pirellulaceae bacterium]
MNHGSLKCREAVGMAVAVTALVASSQAAEPAQNQQVVRCAVIGGLNETGFWPELAERFERATGHRAELVVTGPKPVIAEVFTSGQADVITMHASDTIVNLVADGLAENLQPWLRSDMVLVGPAADPAGIRGEKDAALALRKIIESKSKLLVHASLGAGEVLHDLLAAGEMELDPEQTISLPSDKHRAMLQRAAAEGAYTLVGRIPLLNGKLDDGGMEIMVQGDARLRRPYLVAVARRADDQLRLTAARDLVAFLRSVETQAWIAEYGRGKYDDQPVFFPVAAPSKQ